MALDSLGGDASSSESSTESEALVAPPTHEDAFAHHVYTPLKLSEFRLLIVEPGEDHDRLYASQ